ncbi:MAG TPA: biotin--[acetyl-CoA-carboxylase] ligase, partial [Bacteroidia bacterium]|nr:biotin--[acetyl-CoA-carboxylase] ligase [Bacteroidia bacterium]
MDTLFVGRNIIFLPEVESTNSYAISMLKNVNIAEGTLIQTDDQLQGRGQRGNAWYSEKGRDLITSFVFKPVFLDLNKQFVLYEITALAVYDLLAQYLNVSQYDIKIKWP